MTINEGEKAPEFTLPTDGNGSISLSELKGKNIALYFYPKDDTPGCTKESQAFRDMQSEFEKANTIILGLSKDNITKHDKFKAKYDLPFNLLSDEEGKIVEAYGSWVEKNMYGRKYMGIDRSTFLIDSNGVLQKIWRKVKVTGHVEEVLEAAKKLG